MKVQSNVFLWFWFLSIQLINGFSLISNKWSRSCSILPNLHHYAASSEDDETSSTTATTSEPNINKKDNKAMAFLRKIGKVGGARKDEFLTSCGMDEGSADKRSAGGTKRMRKSQSAYQECTKSGIIDDMTEIFPYTSSGTEWAGFSDRVMGGISSGSISQEVVENRTSIVLRGRISLRNNGGFVQMATDLALDPAVGTVDASDYDGIELDILFQEGDECMYPESYPDGEQKTCNLVETFNIHLKTADCERQFSSYRATFELNQGCWETIRLPWSSFTGHGPGAVEKPLDVSALRRLGVVAIGKEMHVYIAVSGVRFYNVV